MNTKLIRIFTGVVLSAALVTSAVFYYGDVHGTRTKIARFLHLQHATLSRHQPYYYVDANSPYAGVPAVNDPDKPWKSIHAAAQVAQPGEEVVIKNGIYRETVTPANSGSPEKVITYRPFESNGVRDMVIISGLEDVKSLKAPGSSWQREGTSPVWFIDLADSYTSNLGYAEQMFVDGEMMTLARYPNAPANRLLPGKDGFLRVGKIIKDKAYANYPQDFGNWPENEKDWGGDRAVTFTIEDSALKEDSGYWDGASIYMIPSQYESWGFGCIGPVLSQTKVAGGGQIRGMIYRELGSSIKLDELHAGETRYFLYDTKKALDAKGEWWLDKANKRLYAIMPDGGSPTSHTVEMRRRDLAFNLDGRSYITLKNLNLMGATLTTDANYGTGKIFGSTFSRNRKPTAGIAPSQYITLDGLSARYISHFNGTTAHWHMQWLCASGIMLSGQHHTIKNCLIQYSAGNGISLCGRDHEVSNNVILDTNYAAVLAGGIFIYSPQRKEDVNISSHLNIHHNTICRTAFSGIEGSVVQDTRIHDNVIDAAGTVCRDVGGIRLVGFETPNTATRVDHNVVRNMVGALNNPLYFDFSAGYTVDHNLVYDCVGGININNANDARIYNNTIFGIKDAITKNQVGKIEGNVGTRVGKLTPFEDVKAENNLISGRIMKPSPVMPNGGSGYVVEHNVEQPNIAAWFENPSIGDFRLKSTATDAIDKGKEIAGMTENKIASVDIGASEKGAADEAWWKQAGAAAPAILKPAPSELKASVSGHGRSVTLNWKNNAPGGTATYIERSIPTSRKQVEFLEYEQIGMVAAGVNTFTYTDNDRSLIHYYRVHNELSTYSHLTTAFSGVSDACNVNFDTYADGALDGQKCWVASGHSGGYFSGKTDGIRVVNRRVEVSATNVSGANGSACGALGNMANLDPNYTPGSGNVCFSFKVGMDKPVSKDNDYAYAARLDIGGGAFWNVPDDVKTPVNFTVLMDGRLLMGGGPYWLGRITDYTNTPDEGVTISGSLDQTNLKIQWKVKGPLKEFEVVQKISSLPQMVYQLWQITSVNKTADPVTVWFDDLNIHCGAQPGPDNTANAK